MKLTNVCRGGVAPPVMGLGPAFAKPKCLDQAGAFEDVELWEIKEAFAARFPGCERKLWEYFGIEIDLGRPISTDPSSPSASLSAARRCGSLSLCILK